MHSRQNEWAQVSVEGSVITWLHRGQRRDERIVSSDSLIGCVSFDDGNMSGAGGRGFMVRCNAGRTIDLVAPPVVCCSQLWMVRCHIFQWVVKISLLIELVIFYGESDDRGK